MEEIVLCASCSCVFLLSVLLPTEGMVVTKII